MMNRNDALVATVVAGILTELVRKGEDFTAYDVTQKARTLVGTNVYVDHQDVNGLVRGAYMKGELDGYDRQVDASIAGFRYAPVNVPVTVVAPAPVAQRPINPFGGARPGNPIIAAMGKTPTVVQNRPVATVKTSPQTQVLSVNDGNLRLLSDVLNKAGFVPGERVYATYVPSAQKIFVTANPVRGTNDPRAVSAPYTVDVKRNVRISLSRLGADKNTSFIAVPGTKQVEVSCG